MAKHPQISIILPFYNDAAAIDRAIESLSSQTYADFECLLINNNSIDGSSLIAADWCKKDKRFVQLYEKQQGIVYALNRGLDAARGKFIARMDADDWSFPGRLRSQYDYHNSHPEIGVVAGQAIHVPFDSENKGIERYVSWSNALLTHNDIIIRRFVESPVIHPTVMWRKEISDLYGAYEHGNFPEDYELWLRWLSNGVQFHKIETSLIKWYDSPQRLTRTDDRYLDNAFFEIKSFYLANYLKEINKHYPDVLIWGASKTSRKRAALLQKFDIRIQGYVDISHKRQLNDPVIYFKDLPGADRVFILVYLKEETMRSRTVQFLESRGFVEGENYLLVS